MTDTERDALLERLDRRILIILTIVSFFLGGALGIALMARIAHGQTLIPFQEVEPPNADTLQFFIPPNGTIVFTAPHGAWTPAPTYGPSSYVVDAPFAPGTPVRAMACNATGCGGASNTKIIPTQTVTATPTSTPVDTNTPVATATPTLAKPNKPTLY